MKYLKMLGLAALAAVALTAFTVGTASATTLEVGGVAQNKSVSFTATLKSGTSTVMRQTDNSFVDTCTTSEFKGATEHVFTETVVFGKLTTLSFANCTHTTDVISKGSIIFTWAGNTNGRVQLSGSQWTVTSTTFGASLTCSGSDVGTLTGTSSGHSTLDINAVLDCGFFMPSARWEGTYIVTNPTGLGVRS